MMGRTHSVHAEPTTLGAEAGRLGVRARPRPAPAGRRRSPRSATGKISGPVGTYSHLDPELEAEVLAALGLQVDPVSTQIVQRDRHAALLAAIAITGGSLERFATEVRNLQHTEIGELQEPFRAGQKGSQRDAPQAQPDPVRADRRPRPAAARLRPGRARGPAAVARAGHQPQLGRAGPPARRHDPARLHAGQDDRAVEGLVVRPERMRENIERGLGLHASSRVLVALVEDGGLSPRGGLRDRPALRAPGGRRAASAARPAGDRPGRRPAPAARAGSTPASTTRPSCATCPTIMARLDADSRRPLDDAWPARSSARARSATCTRSTTTGCCSSPRTGCRRFDVVLPTPIPDKGRVLTGLSRFWFAETGRRSSRTTCSRPTRPTLPARLGPTARRAAELRGRMMICRRAAVLPVEVIVRGYLAGSGWKDYRRTGAICGHRAAGRACARATGCRSRSSPRRRRPSPAATTRTSTSTR